MRRSEKLLIVLVLVAGFSASGLGQPKVITKEEYDRTLEKARGAMTYPYRETIKFGAYTDHDSPEVLQADEGVEVRSKTVIKEFSSGDRLRIITEIETEKGKKVVRHMQINYSCYAQIGSRWKKVKTCGDTIPLTIGVRPDKEEYSVESTTLEGKNIEVFRRIETNSYTGREEFSFAVDLKGRLIKREDAMMVRTYEYGVIFAAVALPAELGLRGPVARPE